MESVAGTVHMLRPDISLPFALLKDGETIPMDMPKRLHHSTNGPFHQKTSDQLPINFDITGW